MAGWTLKGGKRQDQNKAGRKSATKYLRKMRQSSRWTGKGKCVTSMIQEATSQLERENPAAGRTEQREFSSQCRPSQEGSVAISMENIKSQIKK